MDIDGRAVDGLDGKIVETLDRGGRTVGFHLVVDVPHLHIARRQDDVLGADRIHDIGGGEAVRLQLLRVDVDLHLALLAAIGKGQSRALHRSELRPDKVLAEVIELLLGEPISGEPQLQYGNA